ncbi:phosphoribosylanthranilate isomerase [Croceicoccus sp. F390]|uniref:N-(5'-phosphoribosyl)anthranilate isomerase n=1 Tax=Croceicoccus esteveae TaxID=3075597 RepID=A0ABU2ZJ86_9SPHN|nr:phosphoribosylanthranilate isomerase [Croceicoccus sp. F390]MDT0576667.1 phosphoribosylanthranilate isomerase [Croceicoccus sp. F390]
MADVRIKICGINAHDAMQCAIAARADFAGLVFFGPSPRNVTLAQAAALAELSGASIGRVGLFVDADDSTIIAAVDAARLDAVQFHGSETPERIGQLRARLGLPVWKAIAVRTADDIAASRKYAGAADLVLFDAKTPAGSLPGGMGLAFDWSLLRSYRGAMPWGLAGGLRPGNVQEALKITDAPLVDVSSGVESAPGIKDLAGIAAFAKAVRAA